MNLRLSFKRDILIAVLSFWMFSACKQAQISLSGSLVPYRHQELGEIPSLPGRKVVAQGQVVSMIQESGQIVPGVVKIPTDMAVGDPNGPDRVCRLREGTVVNISALVATTSGETLAIVRIIDPCVKKGETAAEGGVFEGYVNLNDITISGVEEEDIQPRIPQEQQDQTPTQPPLTVIKMAAAKAFQQRTIEQNNIGDSKTKTSTEPEGQVIDATNRNISEIRQLITDDYQGKRNNTIQYNINGCIGVTQIGGGARPTLQGGCDSSTPPASSTSLLPCNVGGDTFRQGGAGAGLAVFGRASAWRIRTLLGAEPGSPYKDNDLTGSRQMCFGDPSCKERNKPTEIPTKIIQADDVAATKNGLAIINWSRFLVSNNNWTGGWNQGASRARLHVQGLNSSGGSVGRTCVHEFSIVSPLVLDLSPSQKSVRTRDGLGEKVRFDLNGDGRAEEAGWIFPNMALLAYDRNLNGRIDDGKELFGQYTNGTYFENGYEALRTLDSDHNQVIDAKDKDFAKLRLWVDQNMDGITQPGELSTLTDHDIRAISLDYIALENRPNELNKVLYQAKYFGPAHCKTSGCNSYDIFFGVESTSFASQDF